MEKYYNAIVDDMQMMRNVESFVANIKRDDERKQDQSLSRIIMDRAVSSGQSCRKRRHDSMVKASQLTDEVDDAMLERASRFANGYDLQKYVGYLEHVPKTVNVVSRVVAEPIPGSGTTLPLNLDHIVSRCSGAYFWPVRFCPVQLAFHEIPRTRVLIFHTGKILGTGSRGPTSARLAIMLTLLKLSQEAGIHLRERDFQIKNLVGMVSLGATINCEGLAKANNAKTGYDRQSFVGLSWRPFDSGICCEVYSTGKMNLPGASTHTQLLQQFSIMHPTLLRFSSHQRRNDVVELVAPSVGSVEQLLKRKKPNAAVTSTETNSTTMQKDENDDDNDNNDEMWEGWGDAN